MTDMQQRMKQEEERLAKLDPWKVICPFPLLPSNFVLLFKITFIISKLEAVWPSGSSPALSTKLELFLGGP